MRPVIYQVLPRHFGNTNTNNAPWGTLEENGSGKFDDFSAKALSQIKDLGVTHMWYTGIIRHATMTDFLDYGIPYNNPSIVKGRAGSPYAISDYYDVSPELANDIPNRINEFKNLVKRTHEAKMKVIIDFVGNHVAREYQSLVKPEGVQDLGATDDQTKAFDRDNNFYYIPGESFKVPESLSLPADITPEAYQETPAKATGNNIFSAQPSHNDWHETVKLNYGVNFENSEHHFSPVPSTWVKMKDILLYWCELGVDGFRCDMAEMIPVEFWQWAIDEVKKQYPEVIFIGEVYIPSLYRKYIFQGKFDYLYDKVGYYDTIKGIIKGYKSTDDLTHQWQSLEGITDQMVRFLENHDEERFASEHYANGHPEKGIPALAASALTHRGPVMIYAGQETGEAANQTSGFSENDGRTSIFDYVSIPSLQKWYNKGACDGKNLTAEQQQLRTNYSTLLGTINSFDAFGPGHFYDLHYANRNAHFEGYSHEIYTFLRHSDNHKLLICINFSSDDSTITVRVPDHALETMNLNQKDAKDPKLVEGSGEIAPVLDENEGYIAYEIQLVRCNYVIFTLNKK